MSSYGFQGYRARAHGADWTVIFVAGLAWVLTFQLVLLARPGGETGVNWFDNLALTLTSGVATVCASLAAGRDRGTRRGVAWAFIAAGLALNTFGEAAWAVQELVLGKADTFPSVADIGYLGLYPPVFLGLLLMPQAPASGLRRMKMLIDVIIGTGAIAGVAAALVLGRILSGDDGSTLETGISLSYPLADVAIVFAVLVLIGRSGRSPARGSLVFLGIGFAAIAVSDSAYTYLTQAGEYGSGSYVDTGWIAGYTMVTMAGAVSAFRQIGTEELRADEEEPPGMWQPVLMYAPIIPLAVVMLFEETVQNTALFAAFLGIVGLMFIRQLIAQRENVMLTRQLVRLTAQLQSKIKQQNLELWHRRAWDGKEPEQHTMPAPTRDWDGKPVEEPAEPAPASDARATSQQRVPARDLP